jgi:signal transduction histidine kinase
VILQYLSNGTTDQASLFDQVSIMSRRHGVGIEVYDRRGTMVAWCGNSGPPHRQEILAALDGRLSSYVTPSPIYSELFVTTPVRVDGETIGAVLVRRTIEVNYPLDNKFISREGLADRLSQGLGVTVHFDFSRDADLRKDGRYASATLFGIDSSKVGVVTILRPAPSAYLDEVSNKFERFNGLLVALLIGVTFVTVSRRVTRYRSLLVRALAMTGLIWLARYALLWFDIPSLYFSSGIFDPGFYASKFGGGLSKSIGDLTLTALALVINILMAARYILSDVRFRSPWWYPKHGAIRVVVALGTTPLIFLLLRGFGTTIRSAVFDSTLNYNDPTVVVPSYELGLMIFTLFLISFCLIVVVVGLTSFILSLFSSKSLDTGLSKPAWIIVGFLFVVAAVVFEEMQAHPLVTIGYRILFGISILAFTYHLHRRAGRTQRISTLGNFLVCLGLATFFFYLQLGQDVQEKDRNRVEVFAGEVLRPVDSWFEFVVDEALQSFATDETVDVLRNDDPEEIDRLSLIRWAQSFVCREGYNCIFAVLDSAGRDISRFSIGSHGVLASEASYPRLLPGAKHIQVEDVGTGINAVKIYSGSVPILSSTSLLGHAIVIVSAGQQALFRGESPAILRSASQENLESFYRPITVSEFRNRVLFTSNNPSLSIGHRLPESVRVQLNNGDLTSLWAHETIGDQDYETFFIKRSTEGGGTVALSLPQLDLSSKLLNIVKMMVYYSLVTLAVLIGYLLVRWAKGRRYRFTFRDKLLIALLVTAILPVIIIAYYGKLSARERLMESTAKRIEQETTTVGLNILNLLDAHSDSVWAALSPRAVEQLASELGADFNFYVGNRLEISSSPELYEAGLLDRRVNGVAYSNVIVKGMRFYLETENIGLYQYAVGYSPLVDENQNIVGIVSVPTLYRQDELDKEVSKQNALIFLFAILIIATTFANRIAAPIHRLTQATKRVSRGDLDIDVRVPNADGEIGELIQSFEGMTKDLKLSRENLILYERELALKEMAKHVAHEIKNPLTPMKLSLQHLRQTYKDKVANFDQIFDDVSKTIIDQIETLSHIASEFSRFARMPKSELRPCDVNAVLGESIQLYEQEGRVRFDLDMQRDLPPVAADREELRRAFINVIRNGIQAMDEAGRMIVKTEKRSSDIVVTIRDFGAGMPEEIKGKLFQPNFSTKTEGMGLGLPIVKGTIDDLGGSISIDSIAGEGTTVTIVLPIASTP